MSTLLRARPVLHRRQLMLGAASLGAALATGIGRARAADTGITLQASWVNDAEFLGYFVAIDKGFYKSAGVGVTFLSGGPDVIPESSLLSGKANIALTTPDTTIEAIVKQGAGLKIIGTQFQKSPLAIISLASKPINTPQDLIGKTLAVPPVNEIMIKAFLKINKIDPSAVRIVPYAFDPTPLIKGEIDGTVDFATDVPYTVELSGKKAVSMLLYDYGVTLYNDTLVATDEVIKNNRQGVVNFLAASRLGWQENFKDTAVYPNAYKDTWFKGTGRATSNDLFSNNTEKPLIESPQGIFSMTEEGIQKNIDYLKLAGIPATREMFDTTLLAEVK